MDSLTVIRTFGIPSIIKNKTEWEYHTSNYYVDEKYGGNGMKLYFYQDGTLSNIEYIWTVPRG